MAQSDSPFGSIGTAVVSIAVSLACSSVVLYAVSSVATAPQRRRAKALATYDAVKHELKRAYIYDKLDKDGTDYVSDRRFPSYSEDFMD